MITGCAGFIGSHAVAVFLEHGHKVVGVDLMTYAGKEENMKSFIDKIQFYKADIANHQEMTDIINKHKIYWIIKFAAAISPTDPTNPALRITLFASAIILAAVVTVFPLFSAKIRLYSSLLRYFSL